MIKLSATRRALMAGAAFAALFATGAFADDKPTMGVVVKIGGICCVMTTGTRPSIGVSWPSTAFSAAGPPVELPIAILPLVCAPLVTAVVALPPTAMSPLPPGSPAVPVTLWSPMAVLA